MNHFSPGCGLWLTATGNGPCGLLGWLAVLAMLVAGIVTMIRHFVVPGCHGRGTFFYQIAHVCLLVFLLFFGVDGVSRTYAVLCAGFPDLNVFALNLSQILFYTGIGLIVFLAVSGIVYVVTRIAPNPSASSCAGVTAAAAGLAVLIGGNLYIGVEMDLRKQRAEDVPVDVEIVPEQDSPVTSR